MSLRDGIHTGKMSRLLEDTYIDIRDGMLGKPPDFLLAVGVSSVSGVLIGVPPV